jgi:hypothetical protein
MKNFIIPDPILDARELSLILKLKEDYIKFTSPGIISKGMTKLKDGLLYITPERLKVIAKNAVDLASEWDCIKLAIEHAGRGFSELTQHASRFTLSQKSVVKNLIDAGVDVNNFYYICGLRSYKIEKSLSNRNYGDFAVAFAEGAITGAPGLIGVPFNIALSFLIYFRAVQSTALYYGYDIKGDPRELEIASEITMESLSPNLDKKVDTLRGIIGKMMLAANITALRHALSTKTYTELAKKGGAELLYVQIRALANKAAKNALKNAGQEEIEAGIFKKMLEQVGRRLPKETGKKAIPLLGAIVGGLSDTYCMSRVVRGSNLIYHKRFLFEKEQRVIEICGSDE